MRCHSKPVPSVIGARPTIPAVSPDELARSVHAPLGCVQCHSRIRGPEHDPALEEVNCRRCHSVMPTPRAALPGTVSMDPGVHWQAAARGNPHAPTCKHCHGTHNVLPSENPQSSVHREQVPKTCGRCHAEVYGDYRESVHGAALAKGNPDAPVCTSCHGEHPEHGPAGRNSPVSPARVPETCASCHEPLGLAGRYGLPPARYKTYRESYHGIANWFGSRTVAQCASCHGAHDIRPSSDPKSSVHKRNLPKTCGKCHRGAGANVAKGRVHVILDKRQEPLLYYVNTGFRVFTILVMSALVAHIMLDLIARSRERRRTRK